MEVPGPGSVEWQLTPGPASLPACEPLPHLTPWPAVESDVGCSSGTLGCPQLHPGPCSPEEATDDLKQCCLPHVSLVGREELGRGPEWVVGGHGPERGWAPAQPCISQLLPLDKLKPLVLSRRPPHTASVEWCRGCGCVMQAQHSLRSICHSSGPWIHVSCAQGASRGQNRPSLPAQQHLSQHQAQEDT